MADTEHYHPNYVKIWAILVVLLIVSIMGPFIGIPWVTLATAFGIAFVKAYLVARNFMHLNVQPRYVVYMLSTVLAFVLLFFSGVSPDVMRAEGSGWVKPAQLAGEVHGESGGHH
jgi:caa(3)-type oxidase subunit IV